MNQQQVSNLRFCCNHNYVDIRKLSNYTLSTWPPSNNFIVFYNEDGTGPAIGKDGESQGRFGDDYWNAQSYGDARFDFAKVELSDQNKQLLKEVLFIYLWYMPLFPGKIRSLTSLFGIYRLFALYADKHKVRMDELYKHPRLYEGLISTLSTNSQQLLIWKLSAFKIHQEEIGITLTNNMFLRELKRLQIPHISTQTAYIPPRIWMGVIKRCDEIIDTYLAHQADIEHAIIRLILAYKHNQAIRPKNPSPFSKRVGRNHEDFIRFESGEYLERFNLRTPLDALGISTIKANGTDKTLVALTEMLEQYEEVCFWYVIAHSIQRKSEVSSLPFDCYREDTDPRLGKVAMLCGRTTKTDSDSDARWIVPQNVKKAINCLQSISTLKHKGVGKLPTATSPLFTAYRPEWTSKGNTHNHPNNGSYVKYELENNVLEKKSIFPEEIFRITSKDYAIAYQLTPRLTEKDWFKEGGLWHFIPHQFRRTLAANLFASGIPEDVIQWLMKHKSVAMSYYYGRNYSRLRVNTSAREAVVSEAYNMKLHTFIKLSDPTNNDNKFAVGRSMIDGKTLNLIEEKKHNELIKLIKSDLLDARPTLLGLCMAPNCAYGGIESASHCAGTDGKGPCKDAVFSKRNGPRLQNLYEAHQERIRLVDQGDMEHTRLTHEIKAIEVYFNATSSNG